MTNPGSRVADLAELAAVAARAGGSCARRYFGDPLSVQRKADGSEFTRADLDAQAEVIRCIRAQRPDDAILAEEPQPDERAELARARCCWIIDPIDGTRNFIRGVPLYACSVAACIDGRPVAGAIYAPQFETLFSAAQGGPLCVNGAPIAPQERSGRASTPLVAIPSAATPRFRPWVEGLIDRAVLRSLGSTALHLAYVAAGAYDAVLCSDSKLWDIAAGVVLVEAAGGVVCGPGGGPLFPSDLAAYANEDTPCIAARSAELLGALGWR
ncbi:MAG: inositol monophosphatase [Phycisphaerales bacterium]|nr:inositol monophosphatase [Phycisphaerales bacterium]